MATLDWMNILGWQSNELEDLRFVGFSYIKQGKWEIALKFYEALLVIAPNNIYDLQTLGALHLQVGNHFKALHFIEKALKIDPLHEPTLLNRTKALFALGFRRQALLQAKALTSSKDKTIASQADALVLSYS